MTWWQLILLIARLMGPSLIRNYAPHPPMRTTLDDHEIVLDRPGCRRRTEADFFFPGGALVPALPDGGADAVYGNWFSGALRRMYEPSLSCNQPAETYRLLLLPTWAAPVAVRVTIGREGVVVAKVLSGAGGYDPGTLVVRTERRLSTREGRALKEATVSADFWTLPTIDYDRAQVRDGTEWILEGRAGNRYHVVHRVSPEAGAFRELCLLLTRLARVRPML